MKLHYIYFVLLPILLFVAFCLPFTYREISYGSNEITNSFDDGFTWLIYTIPVTIATILLVIRNRVTAIIGSSIYVLSFGLSIFMNVILHYGGTHDGVGIGARMILVVVLAGTIIGIIHTVKLFRGWEKRSKVRGDVLDDGM